MKVLVTNDSIREGYGIVGEETIYKGVNGQPIYVGDVVRVKVDIWGEEVVVEEPMVKTNSGLGYAKAFIMGIEAMCDDLTGEISGEIIDIEVVKSYKDIEVGEILGYEELIEVDSL